MVDMEQEIAVPQISCPARRLRAVLAATQMAEQLLEVPTVVFLSFFLYHHSCASVLTSWMVGLIISLVRRVVSVLEDIVAGWLPAPATQLFLLCHCPRVLQFIRWCSRLWQCVCRFHRWVPCSLRLPFRAWCLRDCAVVLGLGIPERQLLLWNVSGLIVVCGEHAESVKPPSLRKLTHDRVTIVARSIREKYQNSPPSKNTISCTLQALPGPRNRPHEPWFTSTKKNVGKSSKQHPLLTRACIHCRTT